MMLMLCMQSNTDGKIGTTWSVNIKQQKLNKSQENRQEVFTCHSDRALSNFFFLKTENKEVTHE